MEDISSTYDNAFLSSSSHFGKGVCVWLFLCFNQLSNITVEMLNWYFAEDSLDLLGENQ